MELTSAVSTHCNIEIVFARVMSTKQGRVWNEVFSWQSLFAVCRVCHASISSVQLTVRVKVVNVRVKVACRAGTPFRVVQYMPH